MQKILFLLLCPLGFLMLQACNQSKPSVSSIPGSLEDRIAKDEDFIALKKSENATAHYIIIGEIDRDRKEHEKNDEAFEKAMMQSEEAFATYLASIGWQKGAKEYARLLLEQKKHREAFNTKFGAELKNLSKDEYGRVMAKAQELANLKFDSSQSLQELMDEKNSRKNKPFGR